METDGRKLKNIFKNIILKNNFFFYNKHTTSLLLLEKEISSSINSLNCHGSHHLTRTEESRTDIFLPYVTDLVVH